ncbi:hypothetical protein [Chlamydia psittaci]|nr:hypothetical protein [Chlamydia psittaci]AEG85408.1 hypothetical protein CPS0C_0397 [Chlamydia psittaci C19/98]AEG86387.1 hypothetical protein CPS0A_0396 [Chlamydia psittaci 01DC11]AEG87361.1 hypothetical protein CPS0B_0395 [Chlamydia psittaci 02DC15]AEG88337.1 hypothetical protein CPS0D_1102 [Chlamydia psittaci 08DC60]AUH45645.1 hypothetical protein CX655_01870 [Chlamydia psittaci]
MSSPIVNVSNPTEMANLRLQLSKQLKILTFVTVILTLAVIGFACYGLFGTPLIAIQLMIWIMCTSMTIVALVCSCAKYHLIRRYENIYVVAGSLLDKGIKTYDH